MSEIPSLRSEQTAQSDEVIARERSDDAIPIISPSLLREG
jgi:hypothetical protein